MASAPRERSVASCRRASRADVPRASLGLFCFLMPEGRERGEREREGERVREREKETEGGGGRERESCPVAVKLQSNDRTQCRGM